MLTAGDIAYNRIHSYEDWWIHPELIDINIQKQLQETTTDIKFTQNYMFPRSDTTTQKNNPI